MIVNNAPQLFRQLQKQSVEKRGATQEAGKEGEDQETRTGSEYIRKVTRICSSEASSRVLVLLLLLMFLPSSAK